MAVSLKDARVGDLRHKILPLSNVEVKAASGSDPDVAGEIEGYAAGLLNIDKGDDIIFPGATEEGLPAFREDGVVAYQHDITSIIGRPLEIEERGDPEYGLFTRAEIVATSLGSDVMKLVKRKILKKLSIGYRLMSGGFSVLNREALLSTLRERTIKQSKIDEIIGDFDRRKLESVFGLFKIKLVEYSVVTFPMNPAAAITGSKGELEGVLASLPFSYHPALVLAANKGYVQRATELFKTLREPANRGLGENHREALQVIAGEGLKVSQDAKELLTMLDALTTGETSKTDAETDATLEDEFLIGEAARKGYISLT